MTRSVILVCTAAFSRRVYCLCPALSIETLSIILDSLGLLRVMEGVTK